jgi:hypothetical protein
MRPLTLRSNQFLQSPTRARRTSYRNHNEIVLVFGPRLRVVHRVGKLSTIHGANDDHTVSCQGRDSQGILAIDRVNANPG